MALFALLMVWESFNRLIHPVPIAFNQAILVAILGLVVNGASMFILREVDHHHQGNGQVHDHNHHGDHNLRAAYLHVLADALTSLLAVFALMAARYLNMTWMDPLVGIVGAIMVARWSLGLLRLTSAVLLDRQAPNHIRTAVKASIEQTDGDRVADLHLWSVGPDIYAAILTVVSRVPRSPE